MSDVIYNHELELKEFEVNYTALREWISENLVGCCGFSVDTKVRVHFTETPSNELITVLDNYWTGLTDDGSVVAERAKARALLIEETKIQYGIKVKAYLGYLCEVNNFTPTEYGQMLADEELYLANTLLLNGALETVRDIVTYYTPTDYFTESMKTALLAEMQKYIALVNTL